MSTVEPLPTRPAVRFEDAARVALANTQLRRNMGKATQTIRAKRQAVVDELPDWEALREAGRAIKERVAPPPRHVPARARSGGQAGRRARPLGARRRRGQPRSSPGSPPGTGPRRS